MYKYTNEFHSYVLKTNINILLYTKQNKKKDKRLIK